MNKKCKIIISVLISAIFLLAFTPPLNPIAGGWTQQFMPDLGGRQIKDIFFLDSLTGWTITPYTVQNDTAYVLKTTNGGDDWFFANIRAGQFVGHNKIIFLKNTNL